MMRLVVSFCVSYAQDGVDVIPHLCIVAREKLKPILSLLTLTKVGLGSLIHSRGEEGLLSHFLDYFKLKILYYHLIEYAFLPCFCTSANCLHCVVSILQSLTKGYLSVSTILTD